MAILKDLIVHGSSRFLNKIYANELEVSAFEAESAIVKKLIAKDATLENATVIGLLDVQGQLHTNTWTNSNIATIDGCFYITPTLSSDSGSIVFSSTSVASLTGTYTAVTSLYIGDSSSGSTVQWTKDSKVLLTGEVQVNGQWLPLGTLLGTLSANATTSSIGLTGLTDNRHNTSSIITDIRNAVSNTSLNYRNLKISLYQRKDGNDSKPLGIYMTAMGTNGKTFIDIYGGVNATTTAGSSGGFADPNLRIGNLSGLGAVEGTTPTGWGIYTTNGYFKGVIVSSAGKIGNFTINSALYSNNHSAWNSNVSGIYINNDGISGGAGGKWWLWNDGSAKIGAMTLSAAGVLTVPAANVSGELTAATINGSKITANSITADQIATGAIKTDELDANAVTSVKIKAGEVKATNIDSGAVTADKLDATTINASNKLTVGALTTATQNNILNSNIQIGGINLLKNTDATTIAKTITIASTSSSSYSEGWTATVTRIAGENSYTVSFDAKANEEDTGVNCFWYSPNTTTSSLSSTGQTGSSGDGNCKVTLTTEWKRYWVTWTQNDTAATDKHLIVGRLSKPSSGTKTVEVRAIKFEVGNKATAWSPAPEDIQDGIDDAAKTATTYITDIDSNKGITIKPADTSGNDYLQMNSSAINFYRNNVETLKIEDSAIRVGKLGNNLRNVYITDSAVQIRNNISVLAEYGDSIKLYNPTTTTVAVEISSTGASFNGNVKATSLSTGTKTASTTGKGIYIDGNGNIYAGNGSSNNFTVTSEGAMTAKSGTIGKYTITSTYLCTGTGNTQAGIGGNQAFWAGGGDSNSAPFRVSYSGVLNATGATISGNITATSLTLGTGVTIGYSSISNPPTIPTTVAELTDSSDYLTTTVASNTYATQSNFDSLREDFDSYVAPIASKEYSNIIATANDDAKGTFYFGKIKPVDYYTPWKIKYRVQVKVNGITDGYETSDIIISGAKNTYYAYQTYNSITNTSYRPYYYHILYTCTQTGINNGYGHLFGISLRYSYNPTTTSNARKINVDVVETEGCTVTLENAPFLYENAAGTGSTNYVNRYSFDGTTQGYTGSGDRNETNHLLNNFSGKTGAKGVWGGSLFMKDGDGKYQNICLASDGTATSASSGNGARTTATTKIVNPNGFEIGGNIYYSGSSYNANTNMSSNNVYASYSAFDSRYSINSTLTANFLTPYAPIYLVGTINQTDNLFYLDSTWWTQTANNVNKVYIYIGNVYDSTTSYCRFSLAEDNTWLVYDGSKLINYQKNESDNAAKTATSYITYVNTTDGIKIHNASDTTNYLQLNSSAISMYKGGIRTFNTDNNGYVTVGKVDIDKRNVYITDGAVQIRNNTSVLAEYGSSIKLYKPGTTTTAVEISSTGATFTGGIVATSLTLESGVTIGYSSISNPPTIPTTVAQLTDSGSYLTTTVAANTYATQTAANNAAQTASKYITAIDQNGIKIHAENNPDNNYTSITADGMSVYQDIDGTAIEVASFGSDGAKIGKEASNSFTVFDRGIIGSNSQGADIFILDSEGNTSGTVPVQTYYNKIQYYYSKSGTSNSHCTIIIPDNVSSGSAKLNYERGYSYWSQVSGKVIQVSSSVSQNFTIGTALDYTITFNTYAHIHFVYDGNRTIEMTIYSDGWGSNVTSYDFSPNFLTYPVFIKMPALTFGTRGDGEIGGFSICFGENNIGSGYGTAAIGVGNIASGDYQTAIGKYNIADQTSLFIIGNGSQSTRSNALTVSTEGNLNIAGTANIGGNTSIMGSLSATGSITQNGTAVSLNGHTHSSTIVYEDETVSISYSAGTIGTRGTQVNCGTTTKTGYTYIGECVLSHTNTSAFSVNLIRNDSTGNVHLMVYRANGNAVTNAQVTIRKIWIKNEFVSTV